MSFCTKHWWTTPSRKTPDQKKWSVSLSRKQICKSLLWMKAFLCNLKREKNVGAISREFKVRVRQLHAFHPKLGVFAQSRKKVVKRPVVMSSVAVLALLKSRVS